MATCAFDLLDASLAMQVEFVNDRDGSVVFLGGCGGLLGLLLGFILRLLFFLP